ncbi:hypothetical protein V8F33_011376 [Rhypophila sp. PSN 637]
MVQLNRAWPFAAVLAFNPYVVLAQRQAKRATELFDVDFSTNDNGGCAYMGEAEIDTQLEEAYEILEFGVALVDEYDDTDEAQRLIKGWFKKPTSAQLTQLRSKYETVLDFLKNGKLFNGHKAFFFCNSNWMELKDYGDYALDADGDIMYHDAPDNTDPWTIEQVAQRDNADEYTYWWVSRMMAYYTDGEDVTQTYCESSDENKGVTIEPDPMGRPYNPWPSITICPNGFQLRGRRRHGGTPRPVAKNSINANSQSIEDLFPVAMTLIHELFHLVLGNKNTFINPNKMEEEYGVAQMVKLTATKALKNPESMSAMAVAYDLTGYLPRVGDNFVEFHTGFVTQG